MMVNPPPMGPLGNTDMPGTRLSSQVDAAGVVLFFVALATLILAAISTNLLLGVAVAAGSALVAVALLFYALRAIIVFWPMSVLAVVTLAIVAAGGVATADAASPSFSTRRAADYAYGSVEARVSHWWERVAADMGHEDSGSPSWRTNWSGLGTNWRTLGNQPIKPLPTFKFNPSWRSSWSSNNRPAYNPPPVRINPPVYNPPPRIPSYNPPALNPPRVPAYNPPVFNPPMPRVPPMPVFPR